MMKHLLITALLLVGGCLGDLVVVPQNEVVLSGADTVVLRCEASSAPAYRIMWTEFTTNSNGLVVSDGRTILSSHPSAARYTILGTGTTFDLQISNITLADGGRYLCQDINAGPPTIFRGSADLVVLASDPVCSEFFTVTGSIVEGQYYSQECEVSYSSDTFAPNMTWTGPAGFDLRESVTDSNVWSITSFTANRANEGNNFECTTSFHLPPQIPEYGATNIPSYRHVFTGRTLVVTWPPQNMRADPIKPTYNVGDQITCYADSKPASTFRWTNMLTQEVKPVGAVFNVTEDMQGFDQTLRCQAAILLDGSLYTNNLFINVTVPGPSTVPPPTTVITTTQPPADGPCNDLTGQWGSTNPNARLCIEMDAKGNLLTLIRNGTDPYFVAGNGKTVFGDYKHVGFTGIWPVGLGGVGGFTGECHNCYGSEVILLSGLSRNKGEAPGCGESSGTHLTPLYVLTRYGPPCRALDAKVYRPSEAHIKYMGIKPENIIR